MTITNQLITQYISQYNANSTYNNTDQLMGSIVSSYLNHSSLPITAMKVASINSIYTGGVKNIEIEALSRHIFAINNIDARLVQGDLTIVDHISKNGQTQICYVFATKYCHYHNPTAYPIFDSNVEKVFMKYYLTFSNNLTAKIGPRKAKTKYSEYLRIAYSNFSQEFDLFKQHYNLVSTNNKDIDKFLWLYGALLHE